MKTLRKLIEIENRIENSQEMYRSITLFPKILTEKKLSDFTNTEKKHLTRKGYRWKVIYQFRNPANGKWKRFAETFSLNSDYHNFNERYKWANLYLDATKKHLKEGFNPFAIEDSPEDISAFNALNKAKELKKGQMSQDSYYGFSGRIDIFIKFLKSKSLIDMPIVDIKKNHIVIFLGQMAKKSSNSNSNNYRKALSNIYTAMVQLDYVPINFVKTIPPLKSKPIAHRLYEENEVIVIYNHLTKHNPELLSFIKFFSYTIIRPVEALRVRVRDINIKDGYFYLKGGKTINGKRKSIPDVLNKFLPEINNLNPDWFLYGKYGSPGEWNVSDKVKRNLYTGRFKKVKDDLNLSKDLTMYGFRHYIITLMYNQLLKQKGSHASAIDELIKFTEHQSKDALMKYLRKVNAINREDYSRFLE